MNESGVSVVICTYNRAQSLRRTLESLCKQTEAGQLSWELVVVDNRSSDSTRIVCEEFKAKLPLLYLFEERPGKSNALNRGISAACHDFLLFTDDDVEVAPDWLVNFTKAGARNPSTAFFSGKIVPQYEHKPPEWIAKNGKTLLASLLVWCDAGETEQPIDMALGANMALRRSRLADTRFDPDLGPDGTETVRGEESRLIKSLTSRGESGVYVPDALVYHWTPSHRMTLKYLWKWYYGEGLTRARSGQIDGVSGFFGVPRYLVREAGIKGWKCLLGFASRKSSIWVKAVGEFAQACGAIHELSRLHRARRQNRI